MKKILLLGLVVMLFFPVFAAGQAQPITATTAPTAVGVDQAISVIFNVSFWLLLAVSGVFFLLGAFYFLTAGQNPDNATKGKSIITYAIIALVVAILAQGIAAFIPNMFGVNP